MTATRTSLRRRFAIIFSALMGALLVIISATLLFVRLRDQKEILETYALGFAKTTKDQLCNHWRLYYRSGAYKFRDIVRTQMGLNEDLYRLFILSVSGEVLFDSMESPDLMLLPEIPRRRLADADLVAVAGLQEPWSERRVLSGVGPVFMVSAPYFEEWGRHPYSVLYIFKYDKVWERVKSDLKSTLFLVLVALATVAAFASWMAGRVARPLLGLTESVRSFSEGKLKSLPQVRTGDEIESLADAFNRMAERIQQQVERLETANRELATLDRMKTDLLANVSHELRTPLAAIRGYVEFIQEGQLGPTTDAQRKGLEVCLRNSERLTKTINMLLDFSRMELGRVPIRPAPFQIGRLLAQIVAGIEADARKRRVSLKTVVDRDLKPVDGDRDRLTQVLENLITNALKFTPDGGEVEVGARLVEEARRVEVWVADTGIGIPPEERSRVFDKFYQTDASATRKFGGIGLGLAIVKSILDAHGAEIVVDGRPGTGSVFRFSLPVAQTQTESGVFHDLVSAGGPDGRRPRDRRRRRFPRHPLRDARQARLHREDGDDRRRGPGRRPGEDSPPHRPRHPPAGPRRPRPLAGAPGGRGDTQDPDPRRVGRRRASGGTATRRRRVPGQADRPESPGRGCVPCAPRSRRPPPVRGNPGQPGGLTPLGGPVLL